MALPPPMMVMESRMDYDDILRSLTGRRVLIWTCNTCARLCGVGGTERAMELADRLRSDGVDITGVVSVSASCIANKVVGRIPDDGRDTILCLSCSISSHILGTHTDMDIVEPLCTLGPGYLSSEGVPVVTAQMK